MTECVVSAPGKVILHGEHSVVYGKVMRQTNLAVLSNFLFSFVCVCVCVCARARVCETLLRSLVRSQKC